MCPQTMIRAVQWAPAESKWWASKTPVAGWKGGMNIEGKKRRDLMGREKTENTFNHSPSSNKLAFPTLTSQQMPLHSHSDLSVSHRHPLNSLLERASWCSVSTKILPDGWAVIFSYADNPLLEIAHNFCLIYFFTVEDFVHCSSFLTKSISKVICELWQSFLRLL